MLFTPQAAVVIPKKHLRDIQFYFLINPKSGNGIGQKITQENPKPFKFLTKFWDGIPFCQEIKDISVNFASLDRLDKLKKVYEQVSSLSRVSLGKEVNQYIVICGGDGSLNPILSQLNEYGTDFSKLAFSMFPLGTFNDMSRSLKSYKLKKYAKASNFSQSKLFKTIGKIVYKMLQGDIQDLDVWKIGVDCEEKGGIKQITKDNCGSREEYIMNYDMEVVRKAQDKKEKENKKIEMPKFDTNKLYKQGSRKTQLFDVREIESDEDNDSEDIEKQIENQIKEAQTPRSNVNNVKILGLKHINKIKSTN